MEFWSLLLQILLLLTGAFVLGLVAERLKQSPIVGYLLAGVAIGPWVLNIDAVFQLAELGVSLLLFSIGLEFSFSRLKRLGAIAVIGGTLQVASTLAIFAWGFSRFWSLGESLALGAMVALSSTAVVMRVLVDRSALDSARGRNAMGILLLQDISVIPLVIMVTMIGQGGTKEAVWTSIAMTGLGALGLAALFYVLFYHVVPFILRSDALHTSRDLIILLAIVIALGSVFLAHSVGLSPALGAFLAGMLLAESPFSTQIRADIGSLRTLFVTLFFTAIGLLANPKWFMFHLHWVAGGLVLMMIGKIIVIYVIVRLFKFDRVQALATGITLAQIGEFSFVLAISAKSMGLIDADTFDWTVSVTIVSLFLSAYLVAYAPRIAEMIIGKIAGGTMGVLHGDGHAAPEGGRIFIIGFGPAGQRVADALVNGGLAPVVIEMRPTTARQAQKKGLTVHIGDAGKEEVLEHAGMSSSCLAVVTVPDPRAARFTIEAIRRLAPDSTVIARSRYHIHNRELENAGAHLIIDEENMVGEHLAEAVMTCLRGEGELSCACALAGLPEQAT